MGYDDSDRRNGPPGAAPAAVKFLIAGGFGVGKTTAIASVSEIEPLTTEAAITEGSEITVILDGRATTATVGRETPLLDGVQRVRPDLPFSCKGGVCGTCRAKLVVGEVAMRRNFALEQDELDAGFVLTGLAAAQYSGPAITVSFVTTGALPGSTDNSIRRTFACGTTS